MIYIKMRVPGSLDTALMWTSRLSSPIRRGALLAMLALATSNAEAGSNAQAGDAHTRDTMARIFESLRTLLPLTLSEKRFADPTAGKRVDESLRVLSANATLLEDHAAGADVGTQHLARSLHDTASDARQRYERGQMEGARFQVRSLTQVCVACHTRLPANVDAPRGAEFVGDLELAALPLLERAQILVAVRRFDDALYAFEALLQRRDLSPRELLDSLVNYLVVCVRVKGDFERPLPTLAGVVTRAEIWEALRRDARSWIEGLRRFAETGLPEPTLDAARELISSARASAIVPYSMEPMVHYIVVSRLLHEYLRTNPEAPRALSEAYYLLGVAEYGVGYPHWLEQPEHYLASAVRVDPKSSFAAQSYALLEEQAIFEYSGSAGTHLPEEIASRLAELERLIRSAPAP